LTPLKPEVERRGLLYNPGYEMEDEEMTNFWRRCQGGLMVETTEWEWIHAAEMELARTTTEEDASKC
jgi:hypothetical protein